MNPASDPKKIQSILETSRKLRASGELDRARQMTKDALQGFDIQPSSESRVVYAGLWYELGMCQFGSKHVKSAIQSYEHAHKCDPEATDAALRLVEHKIDSESALSNAMVPFYLRYLRQGINKNIKHGALRRLQQILRIRLTERPAVVVWRMEMLQKVREVEPGLNFPKLYLGRGFYLREHFEQAIDILGKLQDKAGQSHNVLNMVARSHEKLENLDEAYRLYDKSLRTTPGQAGVHFRLGRLDLKLSENPAST